MAEALSVAEAKRRGVSDVIPESAGVLAAAGASASELARSVALAHGFDLSTHRARPLSADLLDGAERVFVMSGSHAAAVWSRRADARVSLVTDLLPEGDERRGLDVPDPFGGDRAAYEETWSTLRDAVKGLFDRLEAEDEPSGTSG